MAPFQQGTASKLIVFDPIYALSASSHVPSPLFSHRCCPINRTESEFLQNLKLFYNKPKKRNIATLGLLCPIMCCSKAVRAKPCARSCQKRRIHIRFCACPPVFSTSPASGQMRSPSTSGRRTSSKPSGARCRKDPLSWLP